jgi:hypothetical protein
LAIATIPVNAFALALYSIGPAVGFVATQSGVSPMKEQETKKFHWSVLVPDKNRPVQTDRPGRS